MGELTTSLLRVDTPPNRTGIKDLLQAFEKSPVLRSAVSKVAEGVSSTEWTALRTARAPLAQRLARMPRNDQRRHLITRGQKQGEIEQLESAPILELLDYGNPLFTGQQIINVAQSQLDLVGEAYLLMELRGRIPVELWNIPPHWVRERPTPAQPDRPYKIRPDNAATDVAVPSDQVVALANLHPVDPYGRGVGVARSLADEIDTDEFAAKHTKQLFFNGARPDLLILGPGLTPEQAKQLKEGWLQRLQGWWNSFKIHVVHGLGARDLEIKDLGQNLVDLSFVELRKFERDAIITGLGIPPEIIGVLSASNRATIEGAHFIFAQWVLTPRLSLIRGALHRRLSRLFDPSGRTLLDFVDPTPEDVERILQQQVAHPYAFRIDELRSAVEYEALDDDAGKIFPLPMAMEGSKVPLVFDGEEGEEPEPEEPGPEEDEEGEEEEGEGEEEEEEEASIAGVKKNPATEAELRVARILQALTADILIEAVGGLVSMVVEEFGRQQTIELGLDGSLFNIRSPRAEEFLRNRSAARIRGINTTTRGRLRRTLEEGFAAGETESKLANRVRTAFAGASGPRARAIARTETVNAASFGAEEALAQAGIDEKEWLATRDDLTRDGHIGLDGVHIPLDAMFVDPSDGAVGPRPGDMSLASSTVNCRCVLVAHLPNRSRGIGEDSKKARWKLRESKRRPFERNYVRRFRGGLARQREAMLAALRKELGT